jgi:hypothetical protein
LDIVLAVQVSSTIRPLTVAVGELPGLTVIAAGLPDPSAVEFHAASATDDILTSDPTTKARTSRSLTA